MKKEALMFSGSAFASAYMFGTVAVVGLFIFGFAWLIWGND